MGMSCGGLMSYGASADPRVATVGIWNSGLIQPDEKIFAGLHSPVIIVTGGESDIAYANGKRDFETMPAKIPVFYGVHPSVGHGGAYNQDNGGPFGVAAVAWLKWQLMNDTSASGKGYFVGDKCGICGDATWHTASKSLEQRLAADIDLPGDANMAIRRRRLISLSVAAICGSALGAATLIAQTAPTSLRAPEGFDVRKPGIQAGKVERIEYDSKVTGNKRPAVIYLPPGYSAARKYPVLYMLHGIGGNENHWTQFGKTDAILDNLIAENKALPMIIAMPNGRASNEPSTMFAGGPPGSNRGAAADTPPQAGQGQPAAAPPAAAPT